MAIIRSVVEFQGVSNLPEDKYINVFHFISGSPPTSGDLDDVADAISEFYGFAGTGQTAAIEAYYAEDALAAGPHKIKHYIVGAGGATGSPEQENDLINFTPAVGGTSLPHEVAVCLSFHGDLTDVAEEAGAIRPAARRRGRLYLGPLCTEAMEQTAAGSRVNTNFRANLADAAVNLANNPDLTGNDIAWAVYSRAADAAYPIVGGFIDNSFDTQRRRGLAPSTRDVFTV